VFIWGFSKRAENELLVERETKEVEELTETR
jgi:hypothetical protein